MRLEVQQYLLNDPQLRQFVRHKPYWYRRLAREPGSLEQLKQEANHFYGRSFTDRIGRLQNNLQMAMMLMNMFQGGTEQ